MLKNLTIKTRLIFVLSFLAFQLISGALIGILSLRDANSSMRTMYNDRLVALGELGKVMQFLQTNQTLLARALAIPVEQRSPVLSKIDENRAELDKAWGIYAGTYLTEAEKQLVTPFVEARTALLEQGMSPAAAALRAGDGEKATELVVQTVPKLYASVAQAGEKLTLLQLTEAASLNKAAQERYELVRNSCTFAAVLGLAMALAFGVWLVRSIVAPLAEAVRIARNVANGDLTEQVTSNSGDETGQMLKALGDMTTGLREIVGRVRLATETITTGSSEIAQGNEDLSVRTEQQAASLEETASSMEELTATVQQNANSARQGTTMAQNAAAIAKQGGADVADVVQTMEAIDTSSKRISEITSVIDGIAFQTNILALNAAVEAARAGEQGRGFAVVASEVRSLAQRSAAAAKEIKVMIDESAKNVRTGIDQAHQAGTTMADAVIAVAKVKELMDEISCASAEQASGIELVNQAIVQLDQTTQQNAALVEEASAAASSMNGEAQQLAEVVGFFKMPKSAR